jgi:hypothetical protein
MTDEKEITGHIIKYRNGMTVYIMQEAINKGVIG